MTKEELINLQALFKNPGDLENVRLGLSIIQNENFYFSLINGFTNRLIDNWDKWNPQGTFPFVTHVNAIYNILGYERNRIR